MRDRRRLAAIVAADVAGYSRLMHEDDSGTLAALKAHRSELIDPKVADYGGRIVKTVGDGLLLEFPSVVDAARCAVEIQRGMAARNARVPAERRIQFRVGVNAGDIIIDGGDIFGDGVNVAARLEALADPGGICISGKVYDEIRDKLDAPFEDCGVQRLKNIDQGIRVYAMGPNGARAARREPAGTPTAAAEPPSLYGRSEDLSSLCALVESRALVTMVGPGGVGKTRLAEAVAHAARESFGNEVRLVELGPLGDPDLVAITLARGVGLMVDNPRDALELTVQALARQRVLLVLDNCEHVLDEVHSVVTALRRRAPSVHVLATSQEVLRHPDEHVYRLGSLAVPAEATLATARASGAVELFAARARAADPAFHSNDANVAAVIDICRRLDGMPLAIELAAARVPLLGVDGVRERLDERFGLLTAGARVALRKHQTLRAALEWSCSLLSEPEQKVFDRLGVFAGSFSMEAAQKLARDDAIDEWAVLDNVGARRQVAGHRRPCQRPLPGAGDHARVRARAAGGPPGDGGRHAQARGGHARPVRAPLCRHARGNTRGRPGTEARAGPGQPARRIALGDRAGRRSAHRGRAGRRCRREPRLLSLPSAQGRRLGMVQGLEPSMDNSAATMEAARFWLACAELSNAESLEMSAAYARKAIALYGELGDRLGTYLGWCGLIFALTVAGRPDEGLVALEEASKLRDDAWPPVLRDVLHNMAALVLDETGHPEKAREHLFALLASSRQSSNAVAELTALGLLTDSYVKMNEPQRAAVAGREMIALYRAAPNRYVGFDSGLVLRNVATALVAVGDLDEAESIYREALPATRRNYGSGAFVLDDMATYLARRGRLDDAARLSAYAAVVYARVGRRPRMVARRMREELHALLMSQRAPEALERLYEEGRRLSEDEACALALKA